jgi:hypothetical protein
MARKDWYTVETSKPTGFRIRKVDIDDFSTTGAYNVKAEKLRPQGSTSAADFKLYWHCDCFAGLAGKNCRHKQVVRMFQEKHLVNSGRLYNFDRDKWLDLPDPDLTM